MSPAAKAPAKGQMKNVSTAKSSPSEKVSNKTVIAKGKPKSSPKAKARKGK
jgi:hypothetical protein